MNGKEKSNEKVINEKKVNKAKRTSSRSDNDYENEAMTNLQNEFDPTTLILPDLDKSEIKYLECEEQALEMLDSQAEIENLDLPPVDPTMPIIDHEYESLPDIS